jgi:sugar-specific transcriptional regulator TrmB
MESNQSEYRESLIQAGLSAHQATLYEVLVKNGSLPASKLGLKSGLSRPLAYKVLDELIAAGLTEKHDKPGAVAQFTAAHPLKLKEMADKRLSEAKNAELAITGTLEKLVSDFNLQSGKPGVRFFEGIGGIKAVMEDTLSSKSEICAYIDIESIEKYVPEYSREYSRARAKLGIKKRNISIDTPENRYALEGYFPEVTEERLIAWPTKSFNTTLQIYDGKVSYLNLREAHQIGIIIADPEIFEMQKALFEIMWNSPGIYIPPHDETPEIKEDSSQA